MRKLFAMMLLVAVCVHAGDGPDNSVDARDYADPKLKAFDKRIWRNLLKYYVHARQIAISTLKEMETVQDFCWSSYRYLYAIERAANRAQLVWDNVKNFKAENPVDAIVYSEERVFQNADLLFYSDIPAEKVRRHELAQSREAIRERWADRMTRLNDLMPDGLKFQKTYLRLMEINSPDARLLLDTSDKDMSFHMAALSQASRQMANAEAQNEFQDNLSAILESTVKNAANDGTSDPQHQSEYAKTGQRNSFILSLQENVQLSDAIKTGAMFLLVNSKRYATVVGEKEALLYQLEDFSDALQRQQAPER
jgi:hypothetical protein